MKRQASLSRNGFTMIEVMTVIAIVAVLLGLLFPVLSGVRKSGEMTKSMAHMRQIAGWMNLYSSDNRDTVLPSQFNYSPELYPGIYPGKVRSEPVSWGPLHTGTWADILWTENELGFRHEFQAIGNVAATELKSSYVYDSPDRIPYEYLDGNVPNILRSTQANSRNAQPTVESPLGIEDNADLIARPSGREPRSRVCLDSSQPTTTSRRLATTSRGASTLLDKFITAPSS